MTNRGQWSTSFLWNLLVVLVAGAPGLVARTATAAKPPVHTLDLRSLYSAAPSKIGDRRKALDTLVAATCVQGLANRTAPRLYLLYANDKVTSGGKQITMDQLWLKRMQDPKLAGSLLTGRTVVPLASVDAAVTTYKAYIKGLVVWDEKVPATLNAAFTVAGADDLVAVRWDTSSGSMYSRLKGLGLTVKVWLVKSSGASLFLNKQGAAKIPGTSRQTSQSAKADVHLWTLEKYLKPKKLDPTEFGYWVDGIWITKPNECPKTVPAPTYTLSVPNRDWLVARRGLAFDLSPFADVKPVDDPGQSLGTDVAVIKELLKTARAQAGAKVITVRGFPPWPFKYHSNCGLPKQTKYGQAEHYAVHVISPYGAGLDADPWAPVPYMTNASFYSHVPLSETPTPQRRPTPEDLVGAGYLASLAPNGGFEDGTEKWTTRLTAHQVYDDPTVARTGLRFLECYTTKVGDSNHDNLFRDGPGQKPGTTVTLRAFVRAPKGAAKGELVIWAPGGGSTEKAIAQFTAGPAWSEVRTKLTIKNNGHTYTRGQIYLRTAGKLLDIDDVAFYTGNAGIKPVAPAAYAVWFVGDHDSASWLYNATPLTWDPPGRGYVPLAWDFSGHVASRMPLFYNHALRTRTRRDFFVGANSGPGYGHVSTMDSAMRKIWVEGGVRAARVLDSSTGWVLNYLAKVDAAHMRAATPFFSDGIFFQSDKKDWNLGKVDDVPVVWMHNVADPGQAGLKKEVNYWIKGATTTPTFHAFRAVLNLEKSIQVTDFFPVTKEVTKPGSSRKIRFVDPHTFFALARHHQKGTNTFRASYLDVKVPANILVGQKVQVTLTVRNDGWELWSSKGKDRYRLGAHLATSPPAWNSVHKTAGAYKHRFELPQDIHPGKTAAIKISLPAFTKPGVWTLQVDMVKENHTWFEHAEMAGDIPLQLTLRVTQPGSKDGGVPTFDGPVSSDGPGPKDGPGSHDADGGGNKDQPVNLPDGWEAGAATGDLGLGPGVPAGDGCECGLTGDVAPCRSGLTLALLWVISLLAWRRRSR